MTTSKTWTHTACEKCWFSLIGVGRYPTQVRREEGDKDTDNCCFCGTRKITRIWVRQSPDSTALKCKGMHEE